MPSLVILVEDGVIEAPACPPWCALPADHHLGHYLRPCVCAVRGYCADVAGDPVACPLCVQLVGDAPCPASVAIESGPISRTHTAAGRVEVETLNAPLSVEVVQHEELWGPGAPLSSPVCITAGDDDLTAEQARDLAAALLAAADQVDRITDAMG